MCRASSTIGAMRWWAHRIACRPCSASPASTLSCPFIPPWPRRKPGWAGRRPRPDSRRGFAMTDSIARRVMTVASLLAARLVVLIFLFVGDPRVRLASAAIAVVAVGLAWSMARSLARRINSLTAFVDGMLDQSGERPPLIHGDDELGELTRSVSRMTPQIGELVNRLSMELTRREAVLASMTEAVLAVDAQLSVTFCNHSFQQAVGDHGAAQGIPLIRMVRDPDLFRVLKQVVDSGGPVRCRPARSLVHARPVS